MSPFQRGPRNFAPLVTKVHDHIFKNSQRLVTIYSLRHHPIPHTKAPRYTTALHSAPAAHSVSTGSARRIKARVIRPSAFRRQGRWRFRQSPLRY